MTLNHNYQEILEKVNSRSYNVYHKPPGYLGRKVVNVKRKGDELYLWWLGEGRWVLLRPDDEVHAFFTGT